MTRHTERTDRVPMIALLARNEMCPLRLALLVPVLHSQLERGICCLASRIDEDGFRQAAGSVGQKHPRKYLRRLIRIRRAGVDVGDVILQVACDGIGDFRLGMA